MVCDISLVIFIQTKTAMVIAKSALNWFFMTEPEHSQISNQCHFLRKFVYNGHNSGNPQIFAK